MFLERRGRGADALAALARVPADDPFAEDALDASARLLLAEKRGAEALALAQRSAAARRRRAPSDYARLGNVLDELGPPRRGGRRPLPAAARSPTATAAPNRWTYRLLGAAQLDKLKRWPEARAQLELGLKASPERAAAAQLPRL